MITNSFRETLDAGLETPGQVVVRTILVVSPPIPKHTPTPMCLVSPSTDTGLQPMIPTFVFGWPSGDESGDYLAIDLGTLARNFGLNTH